MKSLRVESLPYVRDTAVIASRLSARTGFMFLDSCRQGGGDGRHDILVCDPAVLLETTGETTCVHAAGGASTVHTRDPFGLVATTLAGLTPVETELPFAGGAVGYFAYDLARRLERLPVIARHDLLLPEMWVGIYHHALVVDHLQAACWLVSHPDARDEPHALRAAACGQPALTPAAFGTSFTVTSRVQSEMGFNDYARAWRRIKAYLAAGDVYQVNLAQRFAAEASGDPWDAYQRLRLVNPAPFSAFIRLAQAAVLSSSPERFLRVADGRVETRPIKGTRPRAADPVTDEALARALAASPKDRAENVMIVDLLRNDLGKVCVAGSIKVPRLFAVEHYARVHHLVSTVEGRIRPELSPLEVLRACFPGGSITGAPKIRAMEIIEELEPTRRGVYCGAIGYVSCHGVMDMNIAIRTLVQEAGRLYCWAGGGIVMDSGLEAEYEESLIKASAMLEVFTHAEVPGLGHQAGR